MSSFKSRRNIQKKECGPDRSVSDLKAEETFKRKSVGQTDPFWIINPLQ